MWEKRETGSYRLIRVGREEVRAFVPRGLPPDPPLVMDGALSDAHARAVRAVERFEAVVEASPRWVDGVLVRWEAVKSSEMAGLEATMEDVWELEATGAERGDAKAAARCVAAIEVMREGRQGLGKRLCAAHAKLVGDGGEFRRGPIWVGARLRSARYVPPPEDEVPWLMGALEQWLEGERRGGEGAGSGESRHGVTGYPGEARLVMAGMALAQAALIQPFADGNGRMARLAAMAVLGARGVLPLSAALRRRRGDYRDWLKQLEAPGDWEGWMQFFLECVEAAAEEGAAAAVRLGALHRADREKVLGTSAAVMSVRLLEAMAGRPVVTVAAASDLLKASVPAATKAIEVLERAGVLVERTGKKKGRVWVREGWNSALR